MRDAVIVSAVRTPVGRGVKGTLANTRPDDLAALVLNEAVKRAGIDAAEVEDVYLGCAIPEAEQGLNVARMAALRAGMPDSVGGVTVNRFCSSGLQTIAMAAAAIQTGQADVMLAGGVESMSMVPMSGHNPSPNPELVDERPGAYIGMGLTAENVAAKYGVSRADQDAFALRSHQRAAAAQDAGRFNDEIVPVPVRVDKLRGTKLKSETVEFSRDELIRRDANLEDMAKVRPAFKATGSVSAANSSPFSDGAAAVLLMSAEKAQELGAKPIAKFLGFAVAGVEPELMGIGPVKAVPKVLKQVGLTLADIDLIELNEAFAAQSLAVARELGLPEDKLNVNGGAIALGHPLGCSGAKLATTAIYELRRRGGGKALITMCIGGGMGAAGVIEVYGEDGAEQAADPEEALPLPPTGLSGRRCRAGPPPARW
ncbi:thiolase family protein [uncultured Deinococcus sp.]|uniref:thiolase family protein n=1 Tax=uncultured Deinococcus sp. TaxID=158789 RepID=UPI0037484526